MLCQVYSGGPPVYPQPHTMSQNPFASGSPGFPEAPGSAHSSASGLGSAGPSSDSLSSAASGAPQAAGGYPGQQLPHGCSALQIPQVPLSLPLMNQLAMQNGGGVDMPQLLHHGLGPGINIHQMINSGADLSKLIDPNYLRAASTPEGLANMLAQSQMTLHQVLASVASAGVPMNPAMAPPASQRTSDTGDNSDPHKRTRSSSLATVVVAPESKRTAAVKDAQGGARATAAKPALPPPAEPTKEVKSHTARSLIRMLRAGTGVKTPNNIPIVEAEDVIKKLAGEFAPVEILKTKKRNAGREALSVLLTMYLQKPISMAEAALCFHNPTNRGLEPTTKLWELLGETRTWPPFPETKAATPPANIARQRQAQQQFKQPQPRLQRDLVHRQAPTEMVNPHSLNNMAAMMCASPFAAPATTAPMVMRSPFAQDTMSPFAFDQTPASTTAPMSFMSQPMPTFTGGLDVANYAAQQMGMNNTSGYSMYMDSNTHGQMSTQGMMMPSLHQTNRMDSTGWEASPFGGAAVQCSQPDSRQMPQQQQRMSSPAMPSGQGHGSVTEIASPFSSPELHQQNDEQPKVPSPTSQHRDSSLSGLLDTHLKFQHAEALAASGQGSEPVKNNFDHNSISIPSLSASLSGFLPRDASLSGILAIPSQAADGQELKTEPDAGRTFSQLLGPDGTRQATWSGIFGSTPGVRREDTVSGILGRDVTFSGFMSESDPTNFQPESHQFDSRREGAGPQGDSAN